MKEPPCLTFYLLPKWRQDEATHVFDNCPFFLGNERSVLSPYPGTPVASMTQALTGAGEGLDQTTGASLGQRRDRHWH